MTYFFERELATESPVNGGRNNNGPKVAKSLLFQVSSGLHERCNDLGSVSEKGLAK